MSNTNMRKRLFPAFLLALLLVFVAPARAEAYFCWNAGAQDPQNAPDQADVVFTGTVRELQPMGIDPNEMHTPRTNIVFQVERVWKGLTKETGRKVNADTEAFYEYDFQVGQAYLVYGFHLYPARISIVGCPRVQTKEQVAAEIEALGDPIVDYINPTSAAYIPTESAKPAETVSVKAPAEQPKAQAAPPPVAPQAVPVPTKPVPEKPAVEKPASPPAPASVEIKAQDSGKNAARGNVLHEDGKALDVIWDEAAEPEKKKAVVEKIKEKVQQKPEALDVIWDDTKPEKGAAL